MAAKRKVLCVQGMPEPGLALLEARADVEAEVVPPDEVATLPDRLGDAAGVTLRTAVFDRALVDAAPRLEVVARFGVGYDTVDVDRLTARGIPLMIVGEANAASVAEHALYMMLALAKLGRRFHDAVAERAFGRRYDMQGRDLLGATVLVIGFGRIGRRTAALCRAFGMEVEVHDPFVPDAAVGAEGCRPAGDLGAALGRADFVSVHCPRNADTEGMIGAAELARMKPAAVLVNTARGGIVDEAALAEALRSGGIAAAGLDVFLPEPPADGNPLLDLDNVLLSPHMAGVTGESMERMAVATCQNVLDVFDGRADPARAVNPGVLEGKPLA